MNTLDQLHSGALQGAQRLTLRAGLRELPEEIYALADTLEELDLSGNELDDLPGDLARLHRGPQLDVRALGCLMEELVPMSALAQASLPADADRRPTAEEVAQRLLTQAGEA